MSYADGITSPEVEIAEGGAAFMADSKSRHSDLKAMLDGSKDSLKMEAMKRIINLIAKGKDVSDLFPAVVKNVAAKNLELKKLVYVYLVRYAEEQQDLALLSISTFQRGLKDPNQLIRASALRVLSSIRVEMIAPIMMLAIKESVRDMSPYVRKVAAHAIPKLFVLDAEQKTELIDAIDFLLADKTTLVIGSAVYAFGEICPERNDLIHKHYRKLCQVLVDVDEWGQVLIINRLTRYARTQFIDPNQTTNGDAEKKDSSSTSGSDDDETNRISQQRPFDPDLRLLLKNAKPLLQSRNSSVVLAVAQLYYHLAPCNEIGIIARALVRLLHGNREVQSVVLMNMASISAKKRVSVHNVYGISKNIFEPFLKSFFISSSEPTHVKLLKLEILTNLATQNNIQIILREFQTYVQTNDKELVIASIDAIGRCAVNIREVTDVCLSGLVTLMASKNETIVAQSVVVIKRLLQMQPSAHMDIIKKMAKLIDTVKVAQARASIIWLIGEYCQSVPTIAPDVLRKIAISFVQEDDVVKLQVLNLAAKLLLTNREQTLLLVQYVLQLAKYDQSYDLRDRARFIRNLLLPTDENQLTQFAHKIFLAPKPAPMIESTFKDRDQFQLGTLSHYLNQRCIGYTDLPDFPTIAPDSSVRDVPGFTITATPPVASSIANTPKRTTIQHSKMTTKKASDKFYSDDEDVSDEEDEESSRNEDEEEEEEEDEEEEEEDEELSDEDEEEDDDDDDKSEISEPPPVVTAAIKRVNDVKKPSKSATAPPPPPQSLDLLLDLDFGTPSITNTVPLSANTTAMLPAPLAASTIDDVIETASAQFIPTRIYELFNRVSGQGLRISYRFTRSPSVFSNKMCTIELQFENEAKHAFKSISLIDTKLPIGMNVAGFTNTLTLDVGKCCAQIIGIDFADTTQRAIMNIETISDDHTRKLQLQIDAPVGEQLQPVQMTQRQFTAEQGRLSGLNENSATIATDIGQQAIVDCVYRIANVMRVQCDGDKVCFAGQTLSRKQLLLIRIERTNDKHVRLTINCASMVIGSMLLKELKQSIMSPLS